MNSVNRIFDRRDSRYAAAQYRISRADRRRLARKGAIAGRGRRHPLSVVAALHFEVA